MLRDPMPPCLTWTALLWRIAEISLDYTVVLEWSKLCKDVCKKKVRYPDTIVFTSQTRHKHKSCSKPSHRDLSLA